jgi:hypothetical protein
MNIKKKILAISIGPVLVLGIISLLIRSHKNHANDLVCRAILINRHKISIVQCPLNGHRPAEILLAAF